MWNMQYQDQQPEQKMADISQMDEFPDGCDVADFCT
jgi:hypothetical protein